RRIRAIFPPQLSTPVVRSDWETSCSSIFDHNGPLTYFPVYYVNLRIVPEQDRGTDMARRVKDTTLDNRTARLKLTPRPEPYWKTVERGTHLGYRAGPSTWIMRTYSDGYTFKRIGLADDHAEANGVSVLDFWQAVAAVRHRIATLGTPVPGI